VRAQINHQDIEAAAGEGVERSRQAQKMIVKLGDSVFAPAVDHDDCFGASGSWDPSARELNTGIG
jgi:hypothetical protein